MPLQVYGIMVWEAIVREGEKYSEKVTDFFAQCSMI